MRSIFCAVRHLTGYQSGWQGSLVAGRVAIIARDGGSNAARARNVLASRFARLLGA